MDHLPLVKTLSYDHTHPYQKGQEVFLVAGKFTARSPDPNTDPFAVVQRPPDEDNPDMELLIVGESWTTGGYERHRILSTIVEKKARLTNPKLVVVSQEDLVLIHEHCPGDFDPNTRSSEKHKGMILGLLVYVSQATDHILVF